MNLKQYIKNHTHQWAHPKLDIIVQFYAEDGHVEVEHVFGYVYGQQCIANLFDHDKLIDDWKISDDYNHHMEKLTA